MSFKKTVPLSLSPSLLNLSYLSKVQDSKTILQCTICCFVQSNVSYFSALASLNGLKCHVLVHIHNVRFSQFATCSQSKEQRNIYFFNFFFYLSNEEIQYRKIQIHILQISFLIFQFKIDN